MSVADSSSRPGALVSAGDASGPAAQAGIRAGAAIFKIAVDPVEVRLDQRQRADQHEADREQQHRLGAEQLTEITAGRLPGRPRDRPQEGLSDDSMRYAADAAPTPRCLVIQALRISVPARGVMRS